MIFCPLHPHILPDPDPGCQNIATDLDPKQALLSCILPFIHLSFHIFSQSYFHLIIHLFISCIINSLFHLIHFCSYFYILSYFLRDIFILYILTLTWWVRNLWIEKASWTSTPGLTTGSFSQSQRIIRTIHFCSTTSFYFFKVVSCLCYLKIYLKDWTGSSNRLQIKIYQRSISFFLECVPTKMTIYKDYTVKY